MLQKSLLGLLSSTILRGATSPVPPSLYGAGAILYSTAFGYPLVWNGTAYTTLAPAPPSGGSTNQVLTKNSATDYDFAWASASGGGGGSPNKLTNTDFRQNTLGYNSGGIAANQVLYDGWQAGATNIPTVVNLATTAGGDETLTMAAAGSPPTPVYIFQTVNPVDIEGGNYTLSFGGTGVGAIQVNGGAITFGSSPVTVSAVPAGAAVNVYLGNITSTIATFTAPQMINASSVSAATRRTQIENILNTRGLTAYQNKLMNAGFNINSGNTASNNTTQAAGATFLDKWVNGTNPITLNYIPFNGGDSQLTFSSTTTLATYIQQTLNTADIEGGSYTLSWKGTALAYVSVGGTPKATGATSPVVINGVSQGQAFVVRFQNPSTTGATATVISPQLVNANFAFPAIRRTRQEDILNTIAPTPQLVNKLLNPSFGSNTLNYVSATVTTANQPVFDGWQAGALLGSYSFTASGGDTTLTLNANTANQNFLIKQTVNANDVEGGTYTLSWGGTALGYFVGGSNGEPAGTAMQPSPITITATKGQILFICLGGTVSPCTITAPQVTVGASVQQAIRRTRNQDLLDLSYPYPTLQNKVKNASLQLNTVGYVSGTAGAALQPVFDGWTIVGNPSTLTFPATPGGDVLVTSSIAASGGAPTGIQQTLDIRDVEAGTYTFSWKGTAQGNIILNGNGVGAVAGSGVNSPITAYGVTAGSTIILQLLNTSTTQTANFSSPKFQLSSSALNPAVRNATVEDYLQLNPVLFPAANNRLINSSFFENKNGYVTATTTRAGQQLFDNWNAGANATAISFTAAASGDTTVSFPAASAGTPSYMRQTIDPNTVEGGSYILSWTGTAKGRITVAGTSSAWGASPVSITGVTAGQTLSIDIGNNTATANVTCTNPTLQSGLTPSLTYRRLEQETFFLCNPTQANKLLNASFNINTNNFKTAVVAAAGTPAFDRWIIGTTPFTPTFTTSAGGDTILSFPSSTAGTPFYIQQSLNPKDIEGGTYTLSWKGNAQGYMQTNTVNTGAFAPSPITLTGVVPGDTGFVIQLGNPTAVAGVCTLQGPQLVNSAYAGAVRRSLQEESAIVNPISPASGVNFLLNPSFMMNNSNYISNTAAVNFQVFDDWQGGANPFTITYAKPAGGDMSLTFSSTTSAAPGLISQAIDPKNIAPGSYTLSWQGTVKGCVTVNGSAVVFGTSPQVITGVNAGDTLVVVLGNPNGATATLSAPQLQFGSSVTAVARRMPAEELNALYGNKQTCFNKLHNAGFGINQRALPQSGSIAAGTFFADRWKAGNSAALTLTFTSQPPYNKIAFTTGSVVQIVPGEEIEGGIYTLGFASGGAASGRIYSAAASPGNYVTLPAQFFLTANTTYYVEFGIGGGGGFSNPYLVLSPFQGIPLQRSYQQELAICQRYFQLLPPWGGAWGSSTTNLSVAGEFLIPMYAAPTITWKSGSAFSFMSQANLASSAVASSGLGPTGGYVNITTAAATLAAQGAWRFDGVIWCAAEPVGG